MSVEGSHTPQGTDSSSSDESITVNLPRIKTKRKRIIRSNQSSGDESHQILPRKKNSAFNKSMNKNQIPSPKLLTPNSDEETEPELAARISREIKATLAAAEKNKKSRRKSQSQLSSSLPTHLEPNLVLQIPINLPQDSPEPSSQDEDEEDDPDFKPPNDDDIFLWTEEEQEYWNTLNQIDRLEIKRKEKEVATFRKLEIPGRFLILRAPMNLPSKAMIIQRLEQLDNMQPTDNEYFKLQKFINAILQVPFGKIIPFPVARTDPHDLIHHFLNQVASTLHQSIYGHTEAKERLMQFVAQSISNPKSQGHCIALCGPPGVGKTSLVRQGVAKALGRPFAFLPLGGANDGSYLDGMTYAYEGASWGRIIDILMNTKCMNPIIYIDELDKVSQTKNGEDIFGVLTHLTDTSQNQAFHDKYFAGIEFDLSRALFIFSFNDESAINSILKDRMTVIQLKGFQKNEKLLIAKEYLWKELLEQIGFQPQDVIINEEIWQHLMDRHVGDEPGVRNLKRQLEDILLQLNVIKYYPEVLKHGSISEATDKINSKKQTIKPPTTEISFPFSLTRSWIDYFLSQQNINDDMNLSAKMMYL